MFLNKEKEIPVEEVVGFILLAVVVEAYEIWLFWVNVVPLDDVVVGSKTSVYEAKKRKNWLLSTLSKLQCP